MAFDSAVELALLQKRFPEEKVNECGQLRSDFFCARSSDGCSYEGRLFVMDKALLFVSTYSTKHDLFVSHGDIEQIMAVQHGFLPSLFLILPSRKEHFTNFHNLGVLVELLKTLDLGAAVSSAPVPSVQRMASVPSPSAHRKSSPAAEPCPFFVRSGFCPRLPLCRLDHSVHLQPTTNLMDCPSKISLGNESKFSPLRVLGNPKRFHTMETTEEVPVVTCSNVETDTNTHVLTTPTTSLATACSAAADTVPLSASPASSMPAYQRSISLPVVAELGEKRQEKSGACHVSSKPGRKVAEIEKEMTSSEQTVEGFSPSSCFSVTSAPNVPKVFNFYEKTAGGVGSVEGEECASGDGLGREGVFVFTASPSKSTGGVCVEGEEEEEEVVVKSKPMALVSSGGGGVTREERGWSGLEVSGGHNEMVADLAQQLQLDSDNDSIQGDLDVDTQRRILDSLSPRNDQQPGPSNPATGHHSSPGKRRLCVHFLSGFCRNGQSCPDYHGLDFDLSELEDIDTDKVVYQEPAALPKEVKVFNADHTHICLGDKIILSPEILVACEQQHLSYPVAFQLTHPSSDQTVFCGVLQFTAPSPHTAYLPAWMMEHLEASDGDTVSFSHVDLPKGVFVRLQPVSSAWLGIPYDRRMAMMEFQLRNFQTLTEGTKVTLTYELNRYTLKVLECKPAKGISILDADITTDIVEPADLSRYHSVVEGQAEHTSLGQTIHCSVIAASYRHFVLLSLPGQPLPPGVCVEVKMIKGDPDLFLSQTCTAPSQSRYGWCGQEVGDSCVCLSTDDKEYDVEKPLYAGVVSLCEDAEFTLSFTEKSLPVSRGVGQSPMATGQTLRDSSHLPQTTPTSSSPSLDHTDGPSLPLSTPPGHDQCPLCGSVMPSLRLVMHQRHCAHRTFICHHCKAVLPKAAEKKHKYIAHDLLVCVCGMEYTQYALHHHQRTDCCKRLVQCQFKWCNLSFPMDQLMNHESICGRKKITCSLCQEEVSQLELEIHLEAFHCINTRELDWSKPLRREDLLSHVSKPQFSCGCGLGFDFQDDMEVHQLTDCPLRRLSDQQSPSTGGAIVG